MTLHQSLSQSCTPAEVRIEQADGHARVDIRPMKGRDEPDDLSHDKLYGFGNENSDPLWPSTPYSSQVDSEKDAGGDEEEGIGTACAVFFSVPFLLSLTP